MGLLGSLDTDEFADLLADLGEVPALYRRFLGPCPYSVDALQGFKKAHPNCPLCGGSTLLFDTWTAPPESLTGGAIAFQQAAVGKVVGGVKTEAGDIVATFLSTDYPMKAGDRLHLKSRSEQHAEQIARGQVGGRTALSDRLGYPPAFQVLSVSTAAQVGLPAGADWALSPDGTEIVWSGTGATPAAGATYTVLYAYYVTWKVETGRAHQRVRADNGDPFPDRQVLRVFHHGDTDKKAGDLY